MCVLGVVGSRSKISRKGSENFFNGQLVIKRSEEFFICATLGRTEGGCSQEFRFPEGG